ncbi:MAG TPA: ice-binding family protein [Baekduia sp.]|jgi:hypothetical protein
MSGLPSWSSRPVNAVRRRGALAACLLLAGLGIAAPSALAAPADPVDLGQAASYAALSGASVGNTVSAPGASHTTLRGDLGVKADSQPTGFPPGIVTGATHVGDADATQAHADLVTAYDEVAARTGGTTIPGALAGTTITPGLYTIAGAVSNTTTVTLNAGGDRDAMFVFQVNGALAMAAASRVVLAGGAQASHVFWQVNGAGAIGANAYFAGTLMALDAIGVGHATVLNGRALARNGALTLDDNDIYSTPPVITIDGGDTASTTDTSPTISGTTEVEGPAFVTVTVDDQTLTAVPVDGVWSVSSALLSNDTYPVVASGTDGAGNSGDATQQLTVDTVPPVVTLEGGPSITTNDSTSTIGGTSDVAPGTTVQVTVGTQALVAVVQSTGMWNVTPVALDDGSYTVDASVVDPAGNPGTASQALIVDTSPPAVTIAGGSDALTDDATPDISGTADVPAGTAVSVTVSDEVLTGVVQAGGAWSVTAAALLDGLHRITLDVTDAAGNPASFVQILTVDTVAPAVAIAGGATATTTAFAPTITGTSDAAPGTTVTVTIAGQTMTTLVQPDGTWNATPATVGEGTWTVIATVPDPAGNVGSAGQSLTIAAAGGGGGGGGPAPAPTTPASTPTPAAPGRAPTVAKTTLATIAHSTSQRLTGSSLTIGTKVTAPTGGRVTATARGTITIKGVKATIKLTTTTTKLAAGHSATLKLKPNGTKKSAKAAFAKLKAATKAHKSVTATITITITDATGRLRTLKRTVKLT